MLPSLLSEQLIHRFKFWDHDKIYQGMLCGSGLYRYVATFAPAESQKAYSLGIALCERQQQTVITKAESGYTVWLLLRSPESSCDQPIASAVYATAQS